MGTKPIYWTKEKILQTLRELHVSGVNIRPGGLSNSHPGLWAAGKKLFGSSDNMYAAVGFSKEDLNIRKYGYWTEERAKEAVLNRFHDGKDMNRKVVSIEDATLLHIVEKKIGGWQETMDILGIPNKKNRRKWTDENVKQAILERQRTGKNMKGTVVAKDDLPLFRTATRRFGSWYKALESVEINDH